MGVDDTTLSEHYNIIQLHVAGSSQVSQRAKAIVKAFDGQALASAKSTSIVCLTAKSRYANKLISIVEIAKRELVTSRELKLYQYNAMTSEMVELLRGRQPTAGNDVAVEEVGVEDGEADSDDAFQTMGARSLETPKVRRLPILKTYLCAAPVKELRAMYGEQR